MNPKREKEIEKAINKALKHEEKVQHDQNEKPVTFVEKEKSKGSN